MLNFSLQDTFKVERLNYFIKYTFFVKSLQSLSYDNLSDLGILRDGVDILNLYQSLEIVFKQLCEVVLELRASEKLQNFFPSGRRLVITQVRLKITG